MCKALPAISISYVVYETVKKNVKSLDTATLKAFGGIHPTFLA